MRDVNYGWLLRYLHANGASMFLAMVYVHIARGLYYGSYTQPRVILWTVGVIIFFLMMGEINAIALDISISCLPFIQPRIRAEKRIGPHNRDILEIIAGTLLGDSTLYNYRGRIRLRVEQKSQDYIHFLWRIFKNLGYVGSLPLINKRKNGTQTFYFYTYTWTSFVTYYNEWYSNNIKKLPDNIGDYLSPQALAHWIMDDGAVQKDGLVLCTQSFTWEENKILCGILHQRYGLDARIIKAGLTRDTNIQLWRIRITKASMVKLQNIIGEYMCPSMRYKLRGK